MRGIGSPRASTIQGARAHASQLPPKPPLLSRLIPHLRTLLAVTSVVLLFGVGGGAASAQSSASAPSTLFTAVVCSGCPEAEGVAGLARYRHVFFNPWYHAMARQVKAQGTGTKVYAYKDMSSVRNGGPGMACQPGTPPNTGVTHAEAQANPDWFLLDAAGRRIEWQPWPGCWQMDVGHPGYQQRWLENVLADLRQHGWDGVTIDNANVDFGYFPGRVPAKYSTPAAFQAATRSFLAYVGPRLIEAGFLVLPNIAARPLVATPELWEDWTQFTSGGVQEFFVRWNCDGCYFDEWGWNWTQSLFRRMQERGRIFLAGGPTPERPRDPRLCRASFLIGWDGRSDSAIGCGDYSSEWAFEIGTPTGPRVQVGSAWRRDYTRGAALVNVSNRQSQRVALGAGYLLPGGSPATTVDLPPQSGLVLRRSAGVPATDSTRRPANADGHPASTPRSRSQSDPYRPVTALPRSRFRRLR